MAAATAAAALDAGGGPRQQQRRGSLGRSSKRHQTARGRHDEHGGRDAGQTREVVTARRSHVRVDDRGDESLVLAMLGRDVVRRDRVVTLRLQGRDDGFLVCGPAIRVQETDRNGLDLGRQRREPRDIERNELGAVDGDASRHSVAPGARHQRRGSVGPLVVQGGPILTSDLDEVLEAHVRDERDAAAGPLEQRVRSDSRAMCEHVDRRAHFDDPSSHRRRGIDPIREHLHVRAGLVDHIRERSTRVDAYSAAASGAHRGEPTNVRGRWPDHLPDTP